MMAYAYCDRLSALDASFLALEDANCHMHIGAVATVDASPLRGPGGHLDIERIRTLMEAGIHRIPRYRQRLAWPPLLRHPVWVDDARFNLHYPLRHTYLPPPGDDRLLKRLAGRLMSQQLDRGKPLWEMWIVEGLEGNRFAIVTKVHHCMIDGVGSVELTGTIMRPTPDHDPHLDREPPRWVPRPEPHPVALLRDELVRRATGPFLAAGAIVRALGAPRAAVRTLGDTLEGIGEAVVAGLRSASPTPLNPAIGPHRRFDWAEIDLDLVKEVRTRLGGTVNDVVLAVLTGVLRRFLHQRGENTDTLDFRAMLPVNVRVADGHRTLGNRVAMLVARLPLGERDPRARLEQVTAATREIKQSRQAIGIQTIEELSDRSFTTIFTEFSRLAALVRPFNVVVTNVPGPAFPVYVEGARMLACYPLVPLFRGQALGVALLSYNGRIYWGFNADWDALPDLHDLAAAVEPEFQTLLAAAGVSAPVQHAGGNGASPMHPEG
jgi:diacylglycerol O-acyltransferase